MRASELIVEPLINIRYEPSKRNCSGKPVKELATGTDISSMARPRFEVLHRLIIWFWVIAWGVAMAVWLAEQLRIRDKFWMMAPFLAFAFWIFGAMVVLAIAGLVRLFRDREIRSALLIGIPLLISGWLAIQSGVIGPEPPMVLPTGLTVGYVPEGYQFNFESYGSRRRIGHTYRLQPADEAKLMMGLVGTPWTFRDGERVLVGNREFWVDTEDDLTRVVEDLGGIKIEVSSNALPREELLLVAQGLRYDPDEHRDLYRVYGE